MTKRSTEPSFGLQTTAARHAEMPEARHNQMVLRLTAIPAPPALSVYDARAERAYLLLEHIRYLRSLIDALAPVFEHCADDAADHGGARAESFDLVRAAVEDFVAPIGEAASALTDS